MGRDLTKATPRIRKVFEYSVPRVAEELHETIRPTFVDRTIQEQSALYAQGRDKLANVNLLRKRAGMSPITAQENKKKVTWTMASRHITDLHDDDPINDLSRAIDFGIFNIDGSYVKGENKKENDRYLRVARLIKKLAFEMKQKGEITGDIRIGAEFKTKDLPHIEEAPPYSTEV